jgi:uncharacterized membrane protein YbhN (UPF0104 family)
LPASADRTIPVFIEAYVLAVSISFSPSGSGAFEVTMQLLTGLAASAHVMTALLFDHLVRILIPFALACL